MNQAEIKKGFYRGRNYDDKGTYVIYYATAVDHKDDVVSYVSGLSTCTFEAAVRDRQEYKRCTVAEFLLMVKHELKEPEVKWKKA